MEIAASRLPPIASLRPLTVARCAQVPSEQLQRHHQYYNDVLAQIELLRAERYRLPPDPVVQATEIKPDEDEASQIHKAEYARLHKSLARELTRGCRQLDQLGPGRHVLSDHVHVEIAGDRITTHRSDGSTRYSDLHSQRLVEVSPEGVPEAISRKHNTMFSGPTAHPLPPQKSVQSHHPPPEHFTLMVGGKSVAICCRSLASGVVELEFAGHRLQVSFSGLKPSQSALEKIAYNYLEALQEKVPPARLADHYKVEAKPHAPPQITGNRKPQPVPPPSVAKSAPSKVAPPPTSKAPVDSPKADLKPKPPSPPVRLQLNTGARLSSTRARLRKARKLAAKVTKYDPHPATHTVKEQVARRLAILSEEELEAFHQQININPSGMPSREGWLDEDWLYQKSDEDPLLLHILQLLT